MPQHQSPKVSRFVPAPNWPPAEGDWPGYFTRTLLHRVQPANATRVAPTLGLADCGAVAIRPHHANNHRWLVPCPTCYPAPRGTEPPAPLEPGQIPHVPAHRHPRRGSDTAPPPPLPDSPGSVAAHGTYAPQSFIGGWSRWD